MGIVAALVLLLVGLVVKNKFFSGPSVGAIQISAIPKAAVFIDDVQKGTTNYFDDKISTGEHSVKLVPESAAEQLASWEGKVTIYPGILTAINRQLGVSDAVSSGENVWLEKIAQKDKAALAVVSLPDQAIVKVDGEAKGFSPLLLESISAGSHEVVVVTPGFEEKKISAKTVNSYKLVINVKLAQKLEGATPATESGQAGFSPSPTASPKATPKATPKASPSPSPTGSPKPTSSPVAIEKPYVKIKNTPTGWLNVRSEPSAAKGEETVLTKVNPGETFPYLNEQKYGWYKIEYQEGKEGWVSGTYVELVE